MVCPTCTISNHCPGCSSIGGGAFTELGPFFPNGDGRSLRKNSMSWNRASNLLFVESPAGVGWSYSNTAFDYNIGDASTDQESCFLREKAMQIGNPLLNLDRDAPAMYDYFWSHGMISDEIGLAIMKDCDFDDYTFVTPNNISDSCNNAINDATKIVGDYINNYDVSLDVCYPSIVQQELRLKKMVLFFSSSVFCSGDG
ncbi:hypothetical protein TSUD_214760 [Trifolium subterraneum]|uniref:Uncharacterized protein n=1 Tax=Trifolium subterraneum TaxID=3900 RepID=A0A2Z6N4K9_TRISU|nr:hypothetical protein TSUD_214760 [Trifolium subterraneum]